MSYAFRELKNKDYPSFNKAFKKVFGCQRNKDFWEWKYQKNPSGKGFSAAALEDDKVVAHIGSIPVRFVVNNQVKKACHEVDVFCHPAYRKGGTFLKLARFHIRKMMELGIDFSSDLPTPDIFKVTTTLHGFKKVKPVPKLVKILDITPSLSVFMRNEILAKYMGKIANLFLGINSVCRKKISYPTNIRVTEIKRFDSCFDTFWNIVSCDYPICLIRDSKFLNWRFVDIPVANYKIFCLEENGKIRGYIVLLTSNYEKKGYIIDILTSKNDLLSSEILLQFAIQYFREKCVPIIICWMFPHTHIFRLLKKYGFWRRETTNRWLTVRGYNAGEEFMKLTLDYKNWYITLGDSDDY